MFPRKTFRGRHYLYPEDIASIGMLGSDEELEWKLDEDGLTVETPSKMSCEHAYAFKIALNHGSGMSNKPDAGDGK